MSEPIRSGQAMVAEMDPVLDDRAYVFCTGVGGDLAGQAQAAALGWFVEDEGLSLILAVASARELGLPEGPAMRRIVLTVHSALDGVGLTAAVAGRLAEAGIACNMVAAFHHDHVFVPADDAEAALALLRELQATARS
jgi:uncharacterized protein